MRLRLGVAEVDKISRCPRCLIGLHQLFHDSQTTLLMFVDYRITYYCIAYLNNLLNTLDDIPNLIENLLSEPDDETAMVQTAT